MPTDGIALGDLYTEVIGEHSRLPENKGTLSSATVRERGHNPSCGDEITLELEITLLLRVLAAPSRRRVRIS